MEHADTKCPITPFKYAHALVAPRRKYGDSTTRWQGYNRNILDCLCPANIPKMIRRAPAHPIRLAPNRTNKVSASPTRQGNGVGLVEVALALRLTLATGRSAQQSATPKITIATNFSQPSRPHSMGSGAPPTQCAAQLASTPKSSSDGHKRKACMAQRTTQAAHFRFSLPGCFWGRWRFTAVAGSLHSLTCALCAHRR